MAINGQLNELQIQSLLDALRAQYLANKARASLHYGLVCNYLRQYEQAGAAYQKALSLGIEEANTLLEQVIQIERQAIPNDVEHIK